MLAYLTAVGMLFVSGYAQWGIPRFPTSVVQAWFARCLLALLGCVLGYSAVRLANAPDTLGVALFVIGFGQVHVPTAIVLFLKAQRHPGLS